jgi:hypothetical protein
MTKKQQLREALQQIQRLLAHCYMEDCHCSQCEAYRIAEKALTQKARKA